MDGQKSEAKINANDNGKLNARYSDLLFFWRDHNPITVEHPRFLSEVIFAFSQANLTPPRRFK